LDQIGIAMSPLSNNALFLTYERNPFHIFFERGLNVSLSTDDPLQFHFTKEPLIEEYSVATQIFKLSSTDMCEVARNSVQQSGWELQFKKRWLGNKCHINGPVGNDIRKTNVPNIRSAFRYQTLMEERGMVLSALRNRAPSTFSEDSSVIPSTITEPLVYSSPEQKRNSILPGDVNIPYLLISGPELNGGELQFPHVSMIKERRARGGPGHDGLTPTYQTTSDFDDIFE
jgi:hypothetical protein